MPPIRVVTIREIAKRYGYSEISYNGNALGFEKAGTCVIVYHQTGTVGTYLNHPKKGRTYLLRGDRTILGLDHIFQNPRIHTGVGFYRNRQHVNCRRGRPWICAQRRGKTRCDSIGGPGCAQVAANSSALRPLPQVVTRTFSELANIRLCYVPLFPLYSGQPVTSSAFLRKTRTSTQFPRVGIMVSLGCGVLIAFAGWGAP